MTTIRPAVYIEPPEVEPYAHGLFGATQQLSTTDEHVWIGGVEWESLATYQAALYEAGIYATQNGRENKALSGQAPVGMAWPFAYYAGVVCGAFGRPQTEWEQRARAILELAGQHAAEDALWTGAGGPLTTALNGVDGSSNPLATDLTPTPGTAVSIVKAVSLCERWLADHYSGRGMLHATRDVAGYADASRQVHRDADNPSQLVTTLGTRWVFGGGYDGTGPAAAAPGAGKTWMYVTGQVVVGLSEPTVPASFNAALNRSLNQEMMLAERAAIIGVDGPWAAVLVALN